MTGVRRTPVVYAQTSTADLPGDRVIVLVDTADDPDTLGCRVTP